MDLISIRPSSLLLQQKEGRFADGYVRHFIFFLLTKPSYRPLQSNLPFVPPLLFFRILSSSIPLSSLLQASDGYDPKKSKVSDDTMEQWRTSQTDPDLNTVPGIGPAAVKILKELDNPITNTYQLFGQFLMMKGPGPSDDAIEVDPIEHTEAFWYWLQNIGIKAHRSAIVKAIAEKSATFFAGIYDANAYDDEDDEDE